MAENQQGPTARGTNKKAGNRKKAPSRVASQNAATPEDAASAAAAKKAAGRKQGAPRRAAPKRAASKRQISAEQRYRMIQEAAYFRAEKDGFNCDPWKCWLVAEAEVDAQLATSRQPRDRAGDPGGLRSA